MEKVRRYKLKQKNIRLIRKQQLLGLIRNEAQKIFVVPMVVPNKLKKPSSRHALHGGTR